MDERVALFRIVVVSRVWFDCGCVGRNCFGELLFLGDQLVKRVMYLQVVQYLIESSTKRELISCRVLNLYLSSKYKVA